MATEDKNTKDDKTYNSDITEHDKDILKQEHIHGDGGNDQQLKDRKKDVNFSKDNLDIPKPKDNGSNKPLPDKENQHYEGDNRS